MSACVCFDMATDRVNEFVCFHKATERMSACACFKKAADRVRRFVCFYKVTKKVSAFVFLQG